MIANRDFTPEFLWGKTAGLVGLLLVFGAGCGAEKTGKTDPSASKDALAETDGRTGRSPDGSGRDAEVVEIGEQCQVPADCSERAACVSRGTGQFVCMETCTERWSICEGGSVCMPLGDGAEAVCYIGGVVSEHERCNSNLDCEAGLLCFGATGKHFCLEACRVGKSNVCSDSDYCRSAGQKGVCRSRIGAPCDSGEDCPSQLTCSSATSSTVREVFGADVCSKFDCEKANAGGCPAQSSCRKLPNIETHACFPECRSDSECRFHHGYRCLTADRCEAGKHPERCAQFRDNRGLCVSPTLFEKLVGPR